MNLNTLHTGDIQYPAGLERYLAADAPRRIAALGSLDILQRRTLALFCSTKCPGGAILQTHDLAQALRQAGITVVGGFHSPVERECLTILLRGTQPIVICPARSIEGMRIPTALRLPLQEGRLLLLSPFPETARRATLTTAAYRNRLVAALAGAVFVAHAEPSGKTEELCKDVVSWGRTLYTLTSSEKLLALGAKPLSLEQVANLAV